MSASAWRRLGLAAASGLVTWSQSAPAQGAAESATTFVHTEDVTIQTGYGPHLELYQDASLGYTPRRWRLIGYDGVFQLMDYTASMQIPLLVRAGAPTLSFVIDTNGNVGLGETAPAASLHVRHFTGTTQLRVEEQSPTTASRNLLRMVNNGAATFRFDNTATGKLWGFGSLGSGNFFVGASPGQPLALQLTDSGDLVIAGSLTQNSDRTKKREIQAVDPQALLERVRTLPISSWRYTADQTGARHLGPMAQDFAAAFGLGPDDRHVAPADVAGVSLAGVQALDRRLARKEAELEQLRQTTAELLARLARQDARLAALEAELESTARAAR